ncbi:IS66 family insertion sequence element accessory protein TnpB [Mesorhizobium sp. M0778]|uniref:IS66 family insertion sequence element accessory protein TnpB n=1 Tax=Mesorhizobium sp. M0778 TaxID=2956999 RepID=UPI00333CEB65
MIPAGVKVYLASHPVDFRKGLDGLLALVRDAGSDPFFMRRARLCGGAFLVPA